MFHVIFWLIVVYLILLTAGFLLTVVGIVDWKYFTIFAMPFLLVVFLLSLLIIVSSRRSVNVKPYLPNSRLGNWDVDPRLYDFRIRKPRSRG